MSIILRLQKVLESTLPFFGSAVMVALSTPYTYFVLDFINFFTLSSHYIIINQYIPI